MFDREKVLKIYRVPGPVLDELLVEYVAQADEKIAAIESALAGGDMMAASLAVHTLKGVSGNLRVDDCHEAAVAFEKALKAGNVGEASGYVAAMKSSVAEVKSVIGK